MADDERVSLGGFIALAVVAACWAATGLSACVSAAWFIAGMAEAESAPQQAAAASVAVAIVAIPYVFARAVDALVRGGRVS
jgi:uncharacterized membrane protein